DLAGRGPATLGMLDGAGGEQPMTGTVRQFDPPRLLEHEFGSDVLRWELLPTAGGTRLVLRHSFADGAWSSALAAGWHICLDVADALLAGAPVGPIVGTAALDHGWDELNKGYAGVLGVAPARPWESAH
ncbi:MAG TPA: SRPBCC domain-containing protein, partial [Pseudonocardia sp.]|nr:SRPBCC domain-containing protein [Pseudonocardia sp.]